MFAFDASFINVKQRHFFQVNAIHHGIQLLKACHVEMAKSFMLKHLTFMQKICNACHVCRNPGFGFTTKAKGLQGCGPTESLGVTSHTPRSVRKCEGVNLHTPKATPTLGDGVLVSQPHFEASVRMRLTLPKVGTWSPPGLPQL